MAVKTKNRVTARILLLIE